MNERTQSMGHLIRLRNLISAASERTSFDISPRTKETFGQYLQRVLSISNTLRVRSQELGGFAGVLLLAIADNLANWVATVSSTRFITLPIEAQREVQEILRTQLHTLER